MSPPVLCLMFLSTVQVALSQECPEGWESHGNKCYKHSTSRTTWHNAKGICESEGGTLANLADESINTHLQRNDNRDYWMGLSVTSDKLDWYWNDGSKFVDDESTWDEERGEPNGQHTCVRIQGNGKLGDKECENSGFYFICQADSNPGLWSDVGGYWFFFSDETKSQYEASNYCINKGGYLARKDVFSALHQLVQGRDYWIGLSRRYWLDGSLYLWNNFRPASSDSSSHCFFIFNNRWEGESCSNNNFYICEKGNETTTSSITTTTTTTSTTTSTIILPSITQMSITTNVTPPPTIASNTNGPSFTYSAKTSATLWRSMDTSVFERMVTEYTTGGNKKQLSGTDSGVIALAVFGSIVVLTIGAVLIVMMILRRGNPFCKRRKGNETSAQRDYENVGDTVSYDNGCNKEGQNSTEVGGDNDTSARAISSNNNAVNYEDVHPIDTTNKENADYELIANQYEHIHIEQDNNVNIFTGYESLSNRQNVT